MNIYKLFDLRNLLPVCLAIFAVFGTLEAQTTAFTYQGKLTDAGAATNSAYDIEFRLWDNPNAGQGSQLGSTVTKPSVQAANGIFTVQLDFGSTPFAGGANVYLEISLRPAGSQSNYTALAPRQAVTSAPYAVRSLNATTAETANNSNQLGGIPSNGFIQNTTSQQPGTNFSVSGSGTLGGQLSANGVNSDTQYSIGNNPVLGISGAANTFVGMNAGIVNTTGDYGTFAGSGAGRSNATGMRNSYFGASAGQANTTGGDNSFFGAGSGQANTTGIWNSFYGSQAGAANTTGKFNSFFGYNAGNANTTAINNSFFGQGAGFKNTTGQDNTFTGNGAGQNNLTANGNSFVGSLAGFSNTTGGFSAFFGFETGKSNTTGDGNSFFGTQAGVTNSTGFWNTFLGYQTGFSNTTGANNTFAGAFSGIENTTGDSNSFFGLDAGRHNTSGKLNAFFGGATGRENTTGINNTYFGTNAGRLNLTGNFNSIFGSGAGYNNTADNNAFFGASAGINNTTGAANTFVGINTGLANTVGGNNTLLGNGTNLGANNLNFATAIGSGATVSASNTVVLGRTADTVQIPGTLNVTGTLGANIFSAGTQFNIGGSRILSAGGTNNIFAGINSGVNTTGSGNAFFGNLAGQANTSGVNNAFFGFNAGVANNGGGANTFIGVNAGIANIGSSNNTFLGANAGNTNLTGSGNTYLGANSDGATLVTNAVAIGQKAYAGQSNALVLGSINGVNGASADTDVGIGTATPAARFHVVGSSALIGSVGIGTTAPQAKLSVLDNGSTNVNLTVESSSASGAGILLNNTQQNGQRWLIYSDNTQNGGFGSLHFLNQNTGRAVLGINAVGLGSSGEVQVNGNLFTTGYINVDTLASAGSNSLCFNAVKTLSTCSSSLRYKKDIQPFTGGLAMLNQFKPVTFRWKADDKADLGFVAEEVAGIEPLLTTNNEQGQVEGVKYDRISAVLVNAVKEQQTQIKEQQETIGKQQLQIDALKKLVCANNQSADVCREDQ